MTTASATIPIFLDELRLAKRSSNTLRTYRFGLKVFASIVGEDAELSDQTFIRFLKGTSNLSPSSQHTLAAAVRALYDYHSPGVPLKLLMQRYAQKKGKRLINYEEDAVERVVRYVLAMTSRNLIVLRDRAFIVTLDDTGLRISEACSLRRGDLDWRKGRATIIGKGDSEGIIRFSDRSLEALKYYLAARSKLDGKTGKPLATLPLFARHDRGAGRKLKPVGPHGMWASVRLRIKEAGCEEGSVTPHVFRHHFVTKMYRAENNLMAAKELARHESVETTKRYAHLSDSKLDDTFDKGNNQ